MAEKFPRPYTNTVPRDPEKVPAMEYVRFDRLGIGARSSGMPKETNGIRSLDHVGNDANNSK